MITIVAKCTVSADKVEDFKTTAQPLIAKSREEGGCIAYSLYVDLHNPGILTFIEQWASQEAIDLHNQTEHFISIVPKLGAFQTEPISVNLYQEV